MSSTLEEFKRLQEQLAQSGITYSVETVDYYLEIPPHIQMSFVHRDNLSLSPQESNGSIYPRESLIAPLSGVVLEIKTFHGYNFSDVSLILRVELIKRRMSLYAGNLYLTGKRKEAKEIEQTVSQIAKRLSYSVESSELFH